MNQSGVNLPTDLSRRFVSAILGFGVAVALFTGLFLGAKRIPGFEPLIAIFPQEHQNLLLPISSILIGFVAISVQFYAGERIARRSVRKGFGMILLIVVTATIALLALYVAYVVKIPNNLTGQDEVVVIGWSRLSTCECPPTVEDKDCIAGLTFDIGSCWSSSSINGVKLSLFLSYLIAVEGFAVLAGLLVLQPKARPSRTRRSKGAGRDENALSATNLSSEDQEQPSPATPQAAASRRRSRSSN